MSLDGNGREVSDLIGLISRKNPRVALAISAGRILVPAVQRNLRDRRTRQDYTIRVPGGFDCEELYNEMHEWVLGQVPGWRQRSLVAYAPKRQPSYTGAEEPVPPRLVRLRYDDPRSQAITVAGHPVRVQVKEGVPASAQSRPEPPEISFTVTSPAARDALLAAVETVLAASRAAARPPAFRLPASYGDEWETLTDIPPRTLGSIILPPGQLENLTADLDSFLASEAAYARRGIPWHRGYLFEGPPGTGKSSVARALAFHARLNVHYLPLADARKDTSLVRLVGLVRSRSLLLIEDIDIYRAATERKGKSGSATMSGLLNSLDGPATPHGLVTVLTTNSPGVLDSALVRPGRVDRTEHFGLAGPEEIRRIVQHWFGGDVPPLDVKEMAPAEVIQVLQGCNDAAGAVEALTGTEPDA